MNDEWPAFILQSLKVSFEWNSHEASVKYTSFQQFLVVRSLWEILFGILKTWQHTADLGDEGGNELMWLHH